MQAAMLVHAAGESFKSPLCRGSPVYAVVLGVNSEEALLKLEYKLQSNDIEHVAFREPDAPYNEALMSIGITPVDRDLVSKYVKKYPLIK